MLLLERGKMSAPELAEIFEVTPRTIYRDIETINLAGIPIVTYPGLHGGIGIMESYKVDKRLFTTSDIRTLLIGLSGIQSALGNSETNNALAKIKGMVPNEQLSEAEKHAKHISIDLTPWQKDDKLEHSLQLIQSAMEQKTIIHFDYTNAQGISSRREVEPYRLLYKGNSWYLQGFCYHRNEFRTFRLYRIARLSHAEQTFTPREFEMQALDNSFSSNFPSIKVKILIDTIVKETIAGNYGEGVITSQEGDRYIAEISLMDSEQGYNSLLLLGEHCECLEPPHIRKYIMDKAAVILAVYKKSNS
jgi:predicted DNA-binding transcriptional regulator YafY